MPKFKEEHDLGAAVMACPYRMLVSIAARGWLLSLPCACREAEAGGRADPREVPRPHSRHRGEGRQE
jgi:hypothetical protein